jgi:hypothetical protein
VAERLRARLTYANVMATIAVFLALGGGAFAITLKRNSVGSKHIKPDAVAGVDANESTFGTVPDADRLDGLDSSALATSTQLNGVQGQLDGIQAQVGGLDDVLVGTAAPSAVPAQAFFSFPPMNLQVETDGDADADDNIVVRDTTGGNTLALQTPSGPSVITGANQIDDPGHFGGPANQLDALISGSGRRIFIHCLFPDTSSGDSCYGIPIPSG